MDRSYGRSRLVRAVSRDDVRHNTDPTTFYVMGWDPPRVERAVNATVMERTDRVIYGPRGEVLKVIKDRPFLGYRRTDRE